MDDLTAIAAAGSAVNDDERWRAPMVSGSARPA
jgi:hypothetical protein